MSGVTAPVESMKDRIFDDATIAQMLDHDALQQFRRDTRVPDSLRVHDHNGSARAHSQAWRLAALHAAWPEQKILAREQRGQQAVERAAATIR